MQAVPTCNKSSRSAQCARMRMYCADSMRENVSALCTSRTQNAVRSHGECPGVWCLCSCMLLFFHMHRPHADLSLILVPAALARAESPAGDQEAAVVTDLL